MQQLTVSNQHYLKSVYRMGGSGNGARVSDIARELGVSKASACNAVKALEKKCLVTKSLDHRVCLTEEGMLTASTLLESYEVAMQFFTDILGEDEQSAALHACTLEHTLTPDAMGALSRFMKLYRYSSLAS